MSDPIDFDGAGLRGVALLPGEDGFDAACQGYNTALWHSPDLIVLPERPSDVSAAVRHASDTGRTVHVHATGHGFGVPADGGVLVNTTRMNQVSIDPERRTARVGAGAVWSQVIEAAAPHGLAPLNGSSVDIGVVGYTLGGGLGPMGRTFGFAADHVRRIQLVTADGAIVEASADQEPELFWALRGGKCAVGIVTELEFDLMPVAQVYGGGVFYPGDEAPAVLHAFREWVATLPETTTASIALLRAPDIEAVPPPLRGQLSVHLRYVHVGDEAEGAALLAPMRAAGTVLIDMVATMPYAAIGSVHMDPPDPMPAWDRGMALRELTPEAIEALLATAGPETDVPLIIAEIRAFGGALARDPEHRNAVGGRDAAYAINVIGPYPPPLQDAVAAAGNAVLDAMTPWATGASLINFSGVATAPEHVRRSWPPETLARLQAVDAQWDPDGLFRFGHSLV